MSERPFNALVGKDAWRFPPGLQPRRIFPDPLDEPPPASVFDLDAEPPARQALQSTPSKRDMALAYGAKILMDRVSRGEGTGGDAGYNTVFNHLERRPGVGLPTEKTIDEWQGPYSETLRRNGGKGIIGKAQFAPNTMIDIRKNMKLTGRELGDPDLQDRMFREVLHMGGYDDYLDGKLTKEEFAKRLAGRFTSIARADGTTSNGDPVGTTYDEITNAISAAEAEARRQGYVPGQRPWR